MNLYIKKALKSFKDLAKHPLFSIVIAAFVMIMIQVLGSAGFILPSLVNNFAFLWIYWMVGLGFTLLLGYAGLASLGTAGFIGVGTYVLAYGISTLKLSFPLVIIMAIVIAILLGTVVGFISLRIEGMYLAIITLGLSEILVEFFKFATKITRGQEGFRIERFPILGKVLIEREIYFLLVAVLAVIMVLTLNIIKSPTGRAMLSIKNSTSAAQAMGISVLKYRLLTFVISTVVAVIGGILYMSYQRSTFPSSWGISLSLNILAAVVIGGSKSIWGVGLGTFIIFGLNDMVLKRMAFFQTYGNAAFIINGALIIIIVMFYPGGLIQIFRDLKIKIKSWYVKISKLWKDYRYGKDEQ